MRRTIHRFGDPRSYFKNFEKQQ